MPAVTVVKRKTNVAGGKKHKTYRVSGNSGDTLNTRMRSVDFVGFDDTTITLAAPSGSPGAITITFTTGGGAFTNVDILVVGN